MKPLKSCTYTHSQDFKKYLYIQGDQQIMLTEQNIELIKEIYSLKRIPDDFDLGKIKEATMLKDFYVKKEDQALLLKALDTSMWLSKELATHFFSIQKGSIPLNKLNICATAHFMVLLIKAFLDMDYFQIQINKARSTAPENKLFLKEQLLNLTKEELQSWVEILNNYNIDHFFISDGHVFDMQQELNAACRAVDPDIKDFNVETFNDFFFSTADLFKDYHGMEFELLSTENIIEIIYKYIDNDFYLLGRVAEILHTENQQAAETFLTTYYNA